MKKNNIYIGIFHNDFADFEISKTGKTIKCYEHAAPITRRFARRFKIHEAGAPFACFYVPVFGGKVRYNLSNFAKEAK